MRFLFPLLFACVFLTAGCAGQNELAEQRQVIRRQAGQVDSLRLLQRAYLERLSVLHDSLQFYDDIDSGQYYRDRRLLMDRIERLKYELAVYADGGLTAATLPVDDFFEPASATLSEQGREMLDLLAEKLREDFAERRFRVEGHADNIPIGPGLRDRFPSNWELSAARAAAVVRYLTEAHDLENDRFEVVSFGATRPTASNSTAAGRRQNRRVRIAVLPEPTE